MSFSMLRRPAAGHLHHFWEGAPLQGLNDGISQRLLKRLHVFPFRCIRYLVTISVVTRANMLSPKATIYDDFSN